MLGIVFVIGGVLSLMAGRENVDAGIRVRRLESILEESGRDETQNFVLDSSGAIAYKDTIQDLILSYPGRVYVPKRIIEELKGNKSLMFKLKERGLEQGKVLQINPKSENVDEKDYRGSRQIAREYLGKTKKHLQYLQIKPYFEGKKIEMPNRFWAQHGKTIEIIRERATNKLGHTPSDKECLAELKRTYRVSKGDMDVLTTAIHTAYESEGKTKILARDSHLRDAVEKIREDDPVLKEKLMYEDYADYSEAA